MHSRSFSAPTIPHLRLTPPTPHGSFHETDYDSDDIPSSAAAMPRPTRYRRSAVRTSTHPYASSTRSPSSSSSLSSSPSLSSSSSSSPTLPSEHHQQINPGHFSGVCYGRKIAAFSIVLSPDGELTIRGQLLPSQFPSQTLQDRKSLSQPASPLFFQDPIDPAIAALGLQNPPSSSTMADAKVESLCGSAAAMAQRECGAGMPLVNVNVTPAAHVGTIENVFVNPYAALQQGSAFPMWPVEQIAVHPRTGGAVM